MAEVDPFETKPANVSHALMAELEAAGFGDAHEIGRGSYGVTYRCRQTALNRTVAVKLLTADLSEEKRARFVWEQRAMVRLSRHPNIVNILQVGATESGHPFIVLQYYPQYSLEELIRRDGPLQLQDMLSLGVELAGALETAHRVGVLHRDIKPSNILLTSDGEPELTGFGVSRIAEELEATAGIVTSSLAFTSPEVLAGESPSAVSDVYGLGATLCSAITGLTAFERHSGEGILDKFVRGDSESLPDLREQGIADDVSAVIERAMHRDPHSRQTTAAILGDELRSAQLVHEFPIDEMVLRVESGQEKRNSTEPHNRYRTAKLTDTKGNLPLEMTSFIGRRRELTEVRNLMTGSRLVTLTGIGGVGKTRLALRVAATAQRAFDAGVWLVELGDLFDESLLVSIVASALGLRESARTPDEMLSEFIGGRKLLLVLDNCDRVVDATAWLSEQLLKACPHLRILATSREAFGISGEAVLRVPPLTVPDLDRELPLQGLPRYDAVVLFAERASVAVSTFGLTDDNRVAVTRICHRLDGLPLPIELAAARLRAMSPEQLLRRLTDSYNVLTQGSRSAPTRQQTLRLCIDWSHELCSPQEQLVWSRLSVFAGITELDAAEKVCGEGFETESLLDILTSLVDKSILIREERGSVVQFRLLETLRDYGREKALQNAEYSHLRRLHRDWYLQLTEDAEAEWISSEQLEWIARLDRELPNLREALTFCASDDLEAGLRIAASLYWFWSSRGMYSEGRHWLERLLSAGHTETPIVARVKALYAESALAELQGDIPTAATRVWEGRTLAEADAYAMSNVFITHADGLLQFFSAELTTACSLLEKSLAAFQRQGPVAFRVEALTFLGLSNDLLGNNDRAIECYEQVQEITESRGESVGRSYAQWAMAVLLWRQGDYLRARELLDQALVRFARMVDDPVGSALCLESRGWIDGSEGGAQGAERASVLMGAAQTLVTAAGSSTAYFPHMHAYHDQCSQKSRRALGEKAFAATSRKGNQLTLDLAVAYALGERAPKAPSPPDTATKLTKRERQVAGLVARGLTNRAIADNLVVSPRTAQGHVEHVLTKLGFTSRAQIAAWVVEQKLQS